MEEEYEIVCNICLNIIEQCVCPMSTRCVVPVEPSFTVRAKGTNWDNALKELLEED